MSKDRSRASILSAQLDFEAIDGSKPNNPEFDANLDQDALTDEHASEVPKSIPAPLSQRPPVAPPKPALERTTSKKTTGKKESNTDRFGFYAAIIVLFGLAILLAIFFYIRSVNSNAAGLAYYVLPQQVVNLNGQVIRMQVTIQVRTEDSDWLYENKKQLTDMFPIEFAKIDPNDLHSEEGFETVRAQFKDGLNKALRTDKIESVLINELLMQNHEQ